MELNMDMAVNIAVVGFPEMDGDSEILLAQLNGLIYEIQKQASFYNKPDYGFSGRSIQLNYFTSPYIAGDIWLQICKGRNTTLNSVMPHENINDPNCITFHETTSSITNFEIDPMQSVGSTIAIGNYIAEQSDIALFLWDGMEYSWEGKIWSLLQSCRQKHIPCLWIDVFEPASIYWAVDTYFEPFLLDHLKKSVAALFENKSPLKQENISSKSTFYEKLYSRFQKKYLPMPSFPSEQKNYQSMEDERQKENAVRLQNWHSYFTEKEKAQQNKYQSIQYIRFAIPFFVMIWAAIGLLIERISSCLIHIPRLLQGFGITLAAISFFISAFFYLQSKKYRKEYLKKDLYHELFITQYLLKAVELALHFSLFHIPLSLQKFKNKYSKLQKTEAIFPLLRGILREQSPTGMVFDEIKSWEFLDNTEHFLEAQINLKNEEAAQYQKAAEKMKKSLSTTFILGFISLIFLGCLQFVFFIMNTGTQTSGLLFIDIVKGIFEALVFLLPAWTIYQYSTFSTFRFQENAEFALYQAAKLQKQKEHIKELQNISPIPFEEAIHLSEDITALILLDIELENK